jgi:thiol-disulfide isomerase/thioredoxin
MTRFVCLLCAGLMLGLTALPLSANRLNLVLHSGIELGIEQFGDGADRLLWIPSEFSRHTQRERALLQALADRGDQVWWLNLHSDYFIPPGRNSYDELSMDDLNELIERARPIQGRLTLIATGRGARIALHLARNWQLDHPGDPLLAGVILLHPNLGMGVVQAGETPRLDPVATATNLPIFILQPANSSKRWYLGSLLEALGQSGSAVFGRLLEGISDGYYLREDLSDRERKARRLLPDHLMEAKRLLQTVNHRPRAGVAELQRPNAPGQHGLQAGLKAIAGSPQAAPLQLESVAGQTLDLARLRGQKVLVNFWTTWCPPCVKEIPSLGRLQQQFNPDELQVLGVDVGEDRALVTDFLQRIPAAFPVLLDPQGSTVKSWRINAFPTTFLLDEQGRLRYGYYGALHWDDPEIVNLIRSMK